MRRATHEPIRSCLGCGRRDFQRVMVRLVRDADGRLRVDPIRRAGGRGGYLHRSADCWAGFANRKGVLPAFRATVSRSARMALLSDLQRSGGR